MQEMSLCDRFLLIAGPMSLLPMMSLMSRVCKPLAVRRSSVLVVRTWTAKVSGVTQPCMPKATAAYNPAR